MRALVKLRRRMAKGPLGGVVRAVRMQRLLDRPYELLLRRRGFISVRLGDRKMRFRVSTRQEADRIVSGFGEIGHIESLCQELRGGDVFYDIGSNIGMFACAAAVVCTEPLVVHAFEPEPRTRARLEENVRLNGVEDRVRVHPVALSEKAGEMALRIAGGLGAGTHSLVDGHARTPVTAETVTVRVCTPLDFAAEAGIEPPSVVKCDVEGAEGGVLRGLRPWLEEGRVRRLDVEMHLDTLERQGESAEALERMIRGLGLEATMRSRRGRTINVSFVRA